MPSVLGVAALVGGGAPLLMTKGGTSSTTQTGPDGLFSRREAVLSGDGWMECRALQKHEILETILEAADVVHGLRAGFSSSLRN